MLPTLAVAITVWDENSRLHSYTVCFSGLFVTGSLYWGVGVESHAVSNIPHNKRATICSQQFLFRIFISSFSYLFHRLAMIFDYNKIEVICQCLN